MPRGSAARHADGAVSGQTGVRAGGDSVRPHSQVWIIPDRQYKGANTGILVIRKTRVSSAWRSTGRTCMIDLNEHPSDGAINLDGTRPRRHRSQRCLAAAAALRPREVRARLAATARDWLPDLFPQARLSPDKKTLRCADLSGRPPRKEGSCVIHLEGRFAGWGFDYATGESAGPIDLIYHATGLTNGSLFEEAARLARMDRPAPPARPTPAKPDHSLEVARILAGCRPLAGTPAETYLQGRGLSDPGCPDLLFHPDLTDYEGCRGWPGMVARPRDVSGEPVGGIHRTFLLDDGSGKAPPGKKMLGADRGRLRPPEPDRHGRSSRHRRGHRDRAVGAGDLRRADLGGAVGRRLAPLAVAGGRQPRDDLRRRRRRRHPGRRGAGRSPEHRRHRQRDPLAAARRRLQRRPLPGRDGGRLPGSRSTRRSRRADHPAHGGRVRRRGAGADQPARSAGAGSHPGPAGPGPPGAAAGAAGADRDQERHRHRRLDPGKAGRRAAAAAERDRRRLPAGHPPALGEPAAHRCERHARAQRGQRHHRLVLRRGVRRHAGVRRVPPGDRGESAAAVGRGRRRHRRGHGPTPTTCAAPSGCSGARSTSHRWW